MSVHASDGDNDSSSDSGSEDGFVDRQAMAKIHKPNFLLGEKGLRANESDEDESEDDNDNDNDHDNCQTKQAPGGPSTQTAARGLIRSPAAAYELVVKSVGKLVL